MSENVNNENVRVKGENNPAAESEKKGKKKGGKNKFIIPALIAAAVVIAVLVFVFIKFSSSEKSEREVVTISTLEKIVKSSELSTYKSVYNGVAEVHNEEKPEEIDYYVSYNAEVSVGIDFDQIAFREDPERKIIYIDLPPAKITNISVNVDSEDAYIFQNSDADTVGAVERAQEKCIEDVKTECERNEQLFDSAILSAKNSLTALTQPFVDRYFSGYTIEFRGDE